MSIRTTEREQLSRPLTDPEYLGLISSVIGSLNEKQGVQLGPLKGALRARQVGSAINAAGKLVSTMYETPDSHFQAYQIANLIRKYPFEAPELKPEENALKTFLRGEQRCKRMNAKMRARRIPRIERTRPIPYAAIELKAKQWIEKVLGPFQLERVLDRCDFSDGASIGIHGNATNIGRKFMAESWTVSQSALPYAIEALYTNASARNAVLPGLYKNYDALLFAELVTEMSEIVDYNKLSLVLKEATTHRVIALEPLLNNFLQKGVDLEMRGHLARAGFPLHDQGRNARMAFEGSRNWLSCDPYSTIDVRNASGSMASELIKSWVPMDWWEFMSRIRSSAYLLNGERHEYSSFCSMGNGFCFPLETLIFASICHACGCNDGDFAVYGDDIIVRRERALLVIEVLRYFGFQTNIKKTFVVGPFRESCGTDWYSGEDVRPYVASTKLDTLSAFMAAHNGTLRSPRTSLFLEDLRLQLRAAVKDEHRLLGLPVDGADTHFCVELDEAISCPTFLWDRKCQTWKWRGLVPHARPDHEMLSKRDHPARADVDMYTVLRGARPPSLYTLRYSTIRVSQWLYVATTPHPLQQILDRSQTISLPVNR